MGSLGMPDGSEDLDQPTSLECGIGHHCPQSIDVGPCQVGLHMIPTGAPHAEKPGMAGVMEMTLVVSVVEEEEAEGAEECPEEQCRCQPRTDERRGRGTQPHREQQMA